MTSSFRSRLILVLALAASGRLMIVPAEETASAPRLVVDAGFHSAMINGVAASADGSRLLSVSDDTTGRLYDSAGQLLRVLRVPRSDNGEGMVYACALSPDGTVAALGGKTGYDFEGRHCVYLFDCASGALLRRIKDLPAVINSLDFVPAAAGPALLACGLGRSGGIRVFDAVTGSEIFRDSAIEARSQCVRFNGDATLMAAACFDGALRLYRRDNLTFSLVQKLALKSGKLPQSLAFGPAAATTPLAIGFGDTSAIEIYTASRSALVFAFNPDTTGIDNGTLSSVAFSAAPNGALRLVAGGMYRRGGSRPLVVWESGGRGPRRILEIGMTDSVMSLAPLQSGELLVGAAGPFLARLDADFRLRFQLASPLADMRDLEKAFRLSWNGSGVNFAYKVAAQEPAGFSLASRSLTAAAPDSAAPDTASLPIADWKNSYAPTLNGFPLALDQYEISRSLAIAPDKRSFLLGTEWCLRRFDAAGKQVWMVPSPGTTWAVALSGDGRLGAAAFNDGTIRWYNYINGKEILAFYPHPDKTRWVAWTPSGYYMASPGAEDLIGWHLNRGLDLAPDFYPCSRFRSIYYRPDVVALVLAVLDETTALAQANVASGRRTETADLAARLPPTVAIITPTSGTAFSGGTLRLAYRVNAPSDAPVTAVRALVDGRPAEGAKGLTVGAVANADLSIDVAVPARDCAVSLIADNRNGSSEAVSVNLVYAGAAEFVIKPKLYALVVGVGSYSNPDYRLAYPAEDARAVVAAFTAQSGAIYRAVETKLLVDGQATKDDILDGLDWIQSQTTAKDVAVLFFSGHGINDAIQNYYYLPVGADLQYLKRTGVAFSDIASTVSDIAGKVLFFIDTCHSGNLMKGRKAVGTERDIVAVVNELAAAENGAVVFASSTGDQYSYEDPAWGNGAFTKALVEGLSGAAAYGTDGRITANMLDLYLSERVKELTGNRQTPTTTRPPNVPDFPIAFGRR